jgi:hypothetical protein
LRIAPEALVPFIGHATDNGERAAAPSNMSAAPLQQGAALSVDVATGLLHLVDRLQCENLKLAGRVDYYQAEIEQLRETVRALQPPREEPENTVTSTVLSPVDQVDPPTPHRWWQRLHWGS